MSKEECESIMQPILTYLLPAIGVCRNFPRTLVYNSIKYMGLGIKHLFTTQEILRLRDIIFQVFQRSTTGKLYKTSLELLIIELGMGTDLHLVPVDVIRSIATDTLIKSTCLFLNTHNLELHHNINMTPLREGDQLLMQVFYLQNPTPEVFSILNRCRLYLQVTYVSEICSGDGLAISDQAWSGQQFEVPFRATSWPSQGKPPASEWKIWQSFLKQTLLH
jgi:hypothetical protein